MATATLQELQQQQTVNTNRLNNQMKALALLGEFQSKALAAAEDWAMAARNVSVAYGNAWEKFTVAVRDENTIPTIGQAIAQAVLEQALGKSLSWIAAKFETSRIATMTAQLNNSDAAAVQARFTALKAGTSESVASELAAQARLKIPKTSLERALLSDGLERASKAGLNQGNKLLSDAITAAAETTAISLNPAEFKAKRENAVSSAKKMALEYFGNAFGAIRRSSLESWDNFNLDLQSKWFEGWLIEANQLAGNKDIPSSLTMTDEFERAFWAAWLPGLEHGEEGAFYGQRGTVYESLKRKGTFSTGDGPVTKRLKDLDILKAAGLDDIHWYESEVKEAKALITWARSFRISDFVSMKKAGR